MTTTITTVLGVMFAGSSLASLVLAGAGFREHDDLDHALLLTAGAMFGWAAAAMLFGLGVG